ncbi:hypothetical protein [Polaromonas sp. CF318]|uniref:hypothetical protein n=1 Tax=Polaromonas sp. CF318 TaxID=1144318 RepID=UPI0002FE416C|nr:hypothetical protein [Polaromonas sp. CF318]
MPLLHWLLAARKKKPQHPHQPLQLLLLLLKLPHQPLLHPLPLPMHPHLPPPHPLLLPLKLLPPLQPPLLPALPRSNSSAS